PFYFTPRPHSPSPPPFPYTTLFRSFQSPQAARDLVAKRLGMSADDVTVYVTLLGGGFGRKSKPDFGIEAAVLSKAVGGKPVKVTDRKSTRLNSSHVAISYAVFCLKK